MNQDPVRYRVRFTGRVQGVGFRATVVHLSRGLKVAGFVMNEPDGSVLMEAEGDISELDELVCRIKKEMATNINDVAIDERPCVGYEPPMRIRY